MDKKIDRAEKLLARIGEWIRAADQKITALFAFQGVLLTIMLPNYLNAFIEKIKAGTLGNEQAFFVLLALEFMVFSVLKCAWGIISRINKKQYVKSVLFFGDIQSYTLADFKTHMTQMSDTAYHDALLEQTYINSKIAAQKHTHFRDSVIYFLISFACGISSFVWIKFL